MKALIADWETVGPVIMIAAGVVLVFLGLIAKRRHRRSVESHENENLAE
ncbi:MULTISPECIES: hypothetical protein [unclassified Bradyrhizobium]|nr:MULTISPECIES: hypothetical protein [unclassified Bradyrhizobium]MCK7670973.1 hypothetical protein [Bradyrhizobium sp. 2S1]